MKRKHVVIFTFVVLVSVGLLVMFQTFHFVEIVPGRQPANPSGMGTTTSAPASTPAK